MSNVYTTSKVFTTSGDDDYWNAGADDYVYVENGVTLIDSAGADAFYENNNCEMYIDGSLIGGSPIVVGGNNNKLTTIDIGQNGSVTGLTDAAIGVYGGPYAITNSGALSATNTDPSGGSFTPDGIQIYQEHGVSSGGTITNYGAIVAQRDGVLNESTSGAGYLYNHGSITGGSDAIYDNDDHVAYVYNYGSLDGGVFAGSATVEHLANSGDISGNVELEGIGSTSNNSGVIDGDAFLASGSVYHNSGIINGMLDFLEESSVGSTTFVNSGSIDDDVTFFNAVDFSNTGAVNASIVFATSSAAGGAFNIFNGVGGEVTGRVDGYGANSQYYAGKGQELFDFTRDGAALVVAGTGSDTFEFTAGGLTSATKIKGSASDLDDTLAFTGPGTVTAGDFAHVTGIQKIVLASKDTLALSAALVGSAYDATLAVDASAGSDKVNASALSTLDHVLIYGGLDDVLYAGGHDTFALDAAPPAINAPFETIANINFNQDLFDLPGGLDVIKKIDAPLASGSLSSMSFATDLAKDLKTTLAADSAMLFTASAGTMKGDSFLVVNMGSTAGFTNGEAYVFALTGAQTGALALSNFI